jgi:hypothetical protein
MDPGHVGIETGRRNTQSRFFNHRRLKKEITKQKINEGSCKEFDGVIKICN